ncbi:DUF2796 domain-containing protein [uncultured Pseudoteredinibacter sp.]|uniref:ZrgA family zinc uptake protein n=1 Tax=uncultured Pseudoteredinibacter sp. TaxID=1641701 RepID=UPI002633E28C|nr:DUF2796 domain-containing protein [uncultured Pseudoteredinibacter sp.]
MPATVIFFAKVCSLVLAISSYCYGHSEHHHKTISAHKHGEAEMSIAMEGEDVEIDLQSSAADIVGFEHKAHKEDEKLQLAQAKLTLQAARSIFQFEGGDCKLLEQSSDFSAVEDKISNIADHIHTTHINIPEAKQHSDISAHYHFKCTNIGSLKSLSININEIFPAIEKTDVSWIKNQKQGHSELNIKKKKLYFH